MNDLLNFFFSLERGLVASNDENVETSNDDVNAIVCFPGSHCSQYPAPVVYEALVNEMEHLAKRSDRGYLFRCENFDWLS